MTTAQPLLPKTRQSAIALAACVLVCLAVGGLGSWLTTPGLEPWYASLNKPAFNPPNWIFAPVWTTLFLFMAYAFWRIWSLPTTIIGEHRLRGQAIMAFAAHLLLNLSWSAAFFYTQSPGLGLIVIAVFWVSIVTVMILFFKLDRLAGLLFVPYLAWVSFAAVLNFSIFQLN